MTDINSPSVLCIITFLSLCFALLEEVPLIICEGGLHNPLPQPDYEIAPKGYSCPWNSQNTQEEMSRRTPTLQSILINQYMIKILNLQVQTKQTLHHDVFLAEHQAFFLKRQLGLTQR